VLLELTGSITNNERRQGSALKNFSINVRNELSNKISGWNEKPKPRNGKKSDKGRLRHWATRKYDITA
jgi:hypothetical protein